MRIADNVEMIELPGNNGNLHLVLIWDETEAVLFDTGLPGQMEIIKEAVEKSGVPFEKIKKVILTHQDLDHIGNAKLFAGIGAEIIAYCEEAPYINGEKTPVKLAGMESRINELNPEQKAFYERLKKGYPNLYVNIDRELSDGEVLPVCGGIEVIHTPGHTPGHMALLLKKANIIVAGDAANNENGKLVGANPVFTQDMALAGRSLEKLAGYGADAVVCYHGGVVRIGK